MPDDDIEQEGVVRDLVVEHDGQSLTAVYFVEHGQIQVKVDGRFYRIPKGEMQAAEAVRGLLIGLFGDSARKREQASSWAGWLPGGKDDPTGAE